MNKAEYQEYLKSPHWQSTRSLVLSRDKKCAVCSSTDHLDVHHNTYVNLGHENYNDLVVLCRECHHRHHTTHDDEFQLFGPAKLDIRKKPLWSLRCPVCGGDKTHIYSLANYSTGDTFYDRGMDLHITFYCEVCPEPGEIRLFQYQGHTILELADWQTDDAPWRFSVPPKKERMERNELRTPAGQPTILRAGVVSLIQATPTGDQTP